MYNFAFIALTSLVPGSAAIIPNEHISNSLVLETGDAPFEAHFVVRVSASSKFKVLRDGPPHVIKRIVEQQLSTAQAAELFALAARSTDFSAGCGQVADGTNATMAVIYLGIKHTFSCIGAAQWPVGKNVSTFLSAINRHLPTDMRVY